MNPLKLTDTSSPRDIMHGNFTDMEILLDDLNDNIISSEVGFRAYERIMSMLDFSLTPNGDSRMTMARRALLLLGILNRTLCVQRSGI